MKSARRKHKEHKELHTELLVLFGVFTICAIGYFIAGLQFLMNLAG